jgi:predicted nucleic acid-binding protein
LYTSNFILDETITLLGRRTGYPFAAKVGRSLYSSTTLVILRPDSDDELAALKLFEKHADQGVSFTDCVSCILMRKKALRSVFTFDAHFTLWQFQTFPT